MITDAIVGAFVAVMRALLALIPGWSPDPSAWSDQAATIGAQASTFNGYFPLVVLGGCVVTVWGARLAIVVYRLVTRVWELLPLT